MPKREQRDIGSRRDPHYYGDVTLPGNPFAFAFGFGFGTGCLVSGSSDDVALFRLHLHLHLHFHLHLHPSLLFNRLCFIFQWPSL